MALPPPEIMRYTVPHNPVKPVKSRKVPHNVPHNTALCGIRFLTFVLACVAPQDSGRKTQDHRAGKYRYSQNAKAVTSFRTWGNGDLGRTGKSSAFRYATGTHRYWAVKNPARAVNAPARLRTEKENRRSLTRALDELLNMWYNSRGLLKISSTG